MLVLASLARDVGKKILKITAASARLGEEVDAAYDRSGLAVGRVYLVEDAALAALCVGPTDALEERILEGFLEMRPMLLCRGGSASQHV